MTERGRDHPRTFVTHPFTTSNQRIKTLERLDQAIKQVPRYESSDQGLIFAINMFDRLRGISSSGDYPRSGDDLFSIAHVLYFMDYHE